jgi:hypothetical protein
MDCAQLANTTASGLVALCCAVFGVVYHRTPHGGPPTWAATSCSSRPP